MDFLGFDLQIACLFEEEDVNLFAYLWIFLDFACLFALQEEEEEEDLEVPDVNLFAFAWILPVCLLGFIYGLSWI